MSAEPSEHSPAPPIGAGSASPAPTSFWFLRWGAAIIGAIGVSGVLGAAGFVAERSHMSLWGLWSGPTVDSAAMVAEGGRMLYHLAFVLLDVLNPLPGSGSAAAQCTVLAVLLLWVSPGAWPKRLIEASSRKARWARGALSPLISVVAAVGGLVVLHDLGDVLTPTELLLSASLSPTAKGLVCRPLDIYASTVGELATLAALVLAAGWTLRLSVNTVSRCLVGLATLLLVASTCLLPAAYGRLVVAPDYPQIEFSRDEAQPRERVLVRATDKEWIVWNIAARRTEVVTLREDETVTLGPRRRLAPAGGEARTGECFGRN